MNMSMWTQFFHGAKPAEAIQSLAHAGFSQADLADEHLHAIATTRSARRIKAALHSSGLRLLQAHAPMCTEFVPKDAPKIDRLVDLADPRADIRARELALMLKWIHTCADLDIPVLVVHPGGVRGWTSRAEYNRIYACNLDAYARLAEEGQRCGVKIAMENLVNYTSASRRRRMFGSDSAELLKLVQAVNSPAFGLCLDTGHANTHPAFDIPAFIRNAGPHLIATHISDNHGSLDEHLMPYSGTIHWPPIIQSLRAGGYRGLFNLEIPGENGALRGSPLPRDLLRVKARYAFSWGTALLKMKHPPR